MTTCSSLNCEQQNKCNTNIRGVTVERSGAGGTKEDVELDARVADDFVDIEQRKLVVVVRLRNLKEEKNLVDLKN